MIPSHLPNPYIGPRPFQRGEPLYGRDREILELLDLLIAERIVLLFSPSGAGKTSLIQAGLLPELEQEAFRVLPVIRVGLELPPKKTKELLAGSNRYVLSVLMALEEGVPGEDQYPFAELAEMTLVEYVERRQPPSFLKKSNAPSGNARYDEDTRLVLIFDQFEEILTIDPTDNKVKNVFFAQLGAVLRNPNVYALFAMREEFPAGLAPYLKQIPTRLNTTFRLELLTGEAACQAIQKPAQQQGILFTTPAAQKLADDLRTVRMQQPDETTAERLGPYVEPVQLQVVCYRLWEHLPEGTTEIKKSHFQEAGDVNTALAGYYAERVRAIAEQTGTREYNIRRWFDRHLITEQGVRGQVLRGPEHSQGLDNQAIVPLVDAHLVRAEKRRGATWYELAHDRLIEPVRQNNAIWFQTHLNLLQRQTALWDDQHRPQSLLFYDQSLNEAETWAMAHPEELNPIELEFLAACQNMRTRIQKERRKNRLIRGLAIAAVIISFIAVFASFQAYFRQKDAERLGVISVAQSLAAQSVYQQESGQRELSALLARQAYVFNFRNHGNLLSHIDTALRTALTPPYFNHTFHFQTNTLSVALSADAQILAVGDLEGKIFVWNLAEPKSMPHILHGHQGSVWTLAIDQEKKILVSGSSDKTIRIWDLTDRNAPPRVLHGHDGIVFAVAVAPQRKMLASGSLDQTIRLWDLETPDREPLILQGHTSSVNTVAFSPDGTMLASGGSDQIIHVWHLENRSQEAEIFSGHEGSVNSVVFDPTGEFLASGSADRSVRLWNLLDTAASPAILRGHTEAVLAVTFDAEGQHLIASGPDRALRVWNMTFLDREPRVLRGHDEMVLSLAVSSDAPFLASGGLDNSARLWEMDTSAFPAATNRDSLQKREESDSRKISALEFTVDGQTLMSLNSAGLVQRWSLNLPNILNILPSPVVQANNDVTVGAFSLNGKMLATANEDGTVQVWNLSTPDEPPLRLTGHTGSIRALAFSSDNNYLASGSDDQTVRIWNVHDSNATAAVLENHNGPVFAVAFSPDGKTLASSSAESISQRTSATNKIFLWDIRESHPAPTLLGISKRSIFALVFSPDGKALASGGEDRKIRLWDVRYSGKWSSLTGKLIRVIRAAVPWGSEQSEPWKDLNGHGGAVLSLRFSPDGNLLVSSGADQTVRLWDLRSQRVTPMTFRDHKSGVGSIAISPDGTSLISGAADGTLSLRTMPDTLADRVCEKAWRNLTPAEWTQFIGEGIPYEKTCPALK